jgi:hypothetical protein
MQFNISEERVFQLHQYYNRGSGSVVGIATGYGVEGTEIEFRWGRNFPHVSRSALVPTQPSVQ